MSTIATDRLTPADVFNAALRDFECSGEPAALFVVAVVDGRASVFSADTSATAVPMSAALANLVIQES